MKPIHFTPEEKELLTPYILERQELRKADKFSKYQEKQFVTPLYTLLEKFATGEDYILTKWEQITCCSCINDNIDGLYAKINTKIQSRELLSLSDAELAPYKAVDAANEILEKCGYFKQRSYSKLYSRPKKYLDKINAEAISLY